MLCASFTAQFVLVTAAAALVTVTGTPANKEEIGWHVLVPIALVAFQSCGQAVTSRALKYNGTSEGRLSRNRSPGLTRVAALTSVVLTSNYCDLFSDAELFSLKNAEVS